MLANVFLMAGVGWTDWAWLGKTPLTLLLCGEGLSLKQIVMINQQTLREQNAGEPRANQMISKYIVIICTHEDCQSSPKFSLISSSSHPSAGVLSD